MSTAEVPAGPSWRTRHIPLLWVWFALLFGLVEGWWMVFAKHFLYQTTLMGPHVVWMAPAMDLLWFGLPTLVFLVVAWWRPARVSLRLVTGVFLALGLFTLGLLVHGLHPAAALILAIGLATPASQLAARHQVAFLRLVRRSMILLPVPVAAGAALAFLVPSLAEQSALEAAVQPRTNAPNVLLLILDTVRDWDVSVDGYGRNTTPRLARLARSGVRFDHAWSPSAWTLSSHASMFTGLLPHQTTAGLSDALDGSQRTLAEVFDSWGYATGGFVGNLHYCSRGFGLDRGFMHYEDLVPSAGELLLNSSLGRLVAVNRSLRKLLGYYDIVARRRAPDINRNLLGWITRVHHDRPFFAFVNYFDAHEPYMPPPEYDRRFASPVKRKYFLTDQSIRGARRMEKNQMTRPEILREREAYDGAIAYLDHNIGLLLDSLDARGILENTLVIVTSDHGEMFGAYGLFGHGNSLYEQVMSVPLILSFPGRLPAGALVHERINARNLGRTILEVAGLPNANFPGRSLADLWQPGHRPGPPRPLFFETETTLHDRLRAVVMADTEYIRHQNGFEELHLLRRVSETPNLADLPGMEAELVVFRERLHAMLDTTGADRWH